MTAAVVIAVDAMSGDHGPVVTVPAALTALERHSQLEILLVGQPDVLHEHLDDLPARMQIVAATEVVAMDEPPAQALRGKRDSSMRNALELVRDGRAQACVSAGNTGALVAKSRYLLKMVDGIDRPAIASALPARGGKTCMLDLGANSDCSAQNLLQFAIMGSGLAQGVFGVEQPTVALLNIGSESIKGTSQIREADQLLRQTGLNYLGYIEGDGIMAGTANVVVTDGFTGNVALKTMEGACRELLSIVREEVQRGPLQRALSGLLGSGHSGLSRRFDPRRYNGASLLGLRGSVVKSHGGADELAFGYAIDEAILEAGGDLPQRIAQCVSQAAVTREAV
ncbi:MAG: phosphate acyltransferase PlsX [Gammaproteobacteria bacterium]|nr:phosphate acyltransferase PlsX [Gammaproteobacteria bacterium]NND61438.1 phosphate acyltransferase PlsX [Gammaproteobacteria bacterium]